MPVSQTGAIVTAKYMGYAGGMMIFEYLQIPATQVFILTILMTIDFFSGISKQLSVDRSKLSSHRAWTGLMKKLWTLGSVFVIALVMHGVGPQWEFDTYLTGFLSLLIVAEGYSVLQNIVVIRTGEEATEYDVISKIIKWMGELFISFIERVIGKQ